MNEEEWLASHDPMWMLEGIEHEGSDRKFRLLGCGCCRLAPRLLTDNRSLRAVEVAEQYADGQVTEQKLAETTIPAFRASMDGGSSAAVCFLTAGDGFEASRRVLEERLEVEGPQMVFEFWLWGKQRRRRAFYASLVRDIFGNPFRPAAFLPDWRTDTAKPLARQMYESREFSAMPILADALQDAGCDNYDILSHCRDANATHVRGCWVVDLVLGKE